MPWIASVTIRFDSPLAREDASGLMQDLQTGLDVGRRAVVSISPKEMTVQLRAYGDSLGQAAADAESIVTAAWVGTGALGTVVHVAADEAEDERFNPRPGAGGPRPPLPRGI